MLLLEQLTAQPRYVKQQLTVLSSDKLSVHNPPKRDRRYGPKILSQYLLVFIAIMM